MQSVSSRNWTRVAVSISYDTNHYTTEPPCLTLSKVRYISRVKWSKKGVAPSPIEKGAFLSSSTTIANFTLHQSPLWLGVVVPVRVVSVGQIKLLILNCSTWDHLTMCKQFSLESSFKKYHMQTNYLLIIHIWYILKHICLIWPSE